MLAGLGENRRHTGNEFLRYELSEELGPLFRREEGNVGDKLLEEMVQGEVSCERGLPSFDKVSQELNHMECPDTVVGVTLLSPGREQQHHRLHDQPKLMSSEDARQDGVHVLEEQGTIQGSLGGRVARPDVTQNIACRRLRGRRRSEERICIDHSKHNVVVDGGRGWEGQHGLEPRAARAMPSMHVGHPARPQASLQLLHGQIDGEGRGHQEAHVHITIATQKVGPKLVGQEQRVSSETDG